MHDPGRAGALLLAAEHSVPQPEVERGTDHDHQVGGVQRLAAGLGHQQRVAAGDDPSAHAVGDRGEPGALHERQRLLLGAVGPDVGAEDQHRPLGVREQPCDPVDGIGVGLGAARRSAARKSHGGGVEELVHRDVDEHRAAVRRAGGAEGLVEPVGHLAGGRDGARELGDGGDDRRLVELLEAAASPTVLRGAAADDDQRGPGELGLRDRADAVGDARPGSEHGEPGHPGQLAGGLCRERRGLLVPYVEDPHRRLGLDRSVVHREDVGAGEGEHRLHAMGTGDLDGELTGVPGGLPLGGGGGVRG